MIQWPRRLVSGVCAMATGTILAPALRQNLRIPPRVAPSFLANLLKISPGTSVCSVAARKQASNIGTFISELFERPAIFCCVH